MREPWATLASLALLAFLIGLAVAGYFWLVSTPIGGPT